jgi:hypothetical protein
LIESKKLRGFYMLEASLRVSKAGALLLILLIGFTFLLNAQEIDGDDPGLEDDWDVFSPDLYVTGDQTFIISLGLIFPIVFVNGEGTVLKQNLDPPIGGTGILSYNYHIGPNFYLGGEISGTFNATLGGNMYYSIPLGLRVGYQLYLWRFEFPINLTIGMIWHRFMSLGYYGFYMKGGASMYYRFNSEWSFGITANWCWFPQWVEEKSKSVDGHFIDLLLSARYHF